MRDYTPETESFRDDAIAILNGTAITVAIIGFWTRPVFMAVIALLVAFLTYFMDPRSRGGTILAVFAIGILSLLTTWFLGHQIA